MWLLDFGLNKETHQHFGTAYPFDETAMKEVEMLATGLPVQSGDIYKCTWLC